MNMSLDTEGQYSDDDFKEELKQLSKTFDIEDLDVEFDESIDLPYHGNQANSRFAGKDRHGTEYDPLLESILRGGSSKDHLGAFGVTDEFGVASCTGSWSDDAFWTGGSTAVGGAAAKSGSLLQQDKEADVQLERLLQLEVLEQQYPGLIKREVPDRPPPPYRPPAHRTSGTPNTTSSSNCGASDATSTVTLSAGVEIPSSDTTDISSTISSGIMTTGSPEPGLVEAASSTATTGSPRLAWASEGSADRLTADTPLASPRRISKADMQAAQQHSGSGAMLRCTDKALMQSTLHCTISLFCDAWFGQHQPPAAVQRPSVPELPAGVGSTDGCAYTVASWEAVHRLMFEAVRQLVTEEHQLCYGVQGASESKPWKIHHRPVTAVRRLASYSTVQESVTKKVEIVLGYRPAVQRYSRSVQWATQRRDAVDQVLVQEVVSEEPDWTDYHADEEGVKRRLAADLLQAMLSETCRLFALILKAKAQQAAVCS